MCLNELIESDCPPILVKLFSRSLKWCFIKFEPKKKYDDDDNEEQNNLQLTTLIWFIKYLAKWIGKKREREKLCFYT